MAVAVLWRAVREGCAFESGKSLESSSLYIPSSAVCKKTTKLMKIFLFPTPQTDIESDLTEFPATEFRVTDLSWNRSLLAP